MSETVAPPREEFRKLHGGIAVVFFDFDGTLTATPGDRAARAAKRTELCCRAPMLEPRLRALRSTGATLGIISKSSEGTIRAALDAAGLANLFDAPLVAKAIGFEGKAGFIEELAQKGFLPRLGSGCGFSAPVHRVLLVDDDMMELEQARAHGLQTYAAPEEGGLQEEDFDAIIGALSQPRTRSLSHLPAFPGVSCLSLPSQHIKPGRKPPRSAPAGAGDLLCPPPLFLAEGLTERSSPSGANHRNLILFSGDLLSPEESRMRRVAQPLS